LAQLDRPLSPAEAADILPSVLNVLSYLHAKQLAHGRLKPSNILAAGDQLKISSDSVRPAGEWRSNLDAPGLCDPPEIARDGATPAGDVWSVGVSLVAALTMQMPIFDGNGVVAQVLDDLPSQFRVPVANCLRLDPRDRWTASELAKSFQRKADTPVAPLSKATSARSAKSRYLLPILAVAAGLALAATAVVTRFTGDRAAAVAPVVEPEKVTPKAVPVQPAPPPPRAATPKSPGKSTGQGILTQVLPDVPSQARNTIHGKVTVNVRVRVAADGSVIDARNESSGSSRFFGNLALQAARQWKFQAGSSEAQPGAWNLHFQFVRDPRRPVSVIATPAR
jgi:TonB family protein